MAKLTASTPFMRSFDEITVDTVVKVKVGKLVIDGNFRGLKDQFLTVVVLLPVAGANVSIHHDFAVSRETAIHCLDNNKPITLK